MWGPMPEDEVLWVLDKPWRRQGEERHITTGAVALVEDLARDPTLPQDCERVEVAATACPDSPPIWSRLACSSGRKKALVGSGPHQGKHETVTTTVKVNSEAQRLGMPAAQVRDERAHGVHGSVVSNSLCAMERSRVGDQKCEDVFAFTLDPS